MMTVRNMLKMKKKLKVRKCTKLKKATMVKNRFAFEWVRFLFLTPPYSNMFEVEACVCSQYHSFIFSFCWFYYNSKTIFQAYFFFF